MISCWSYSALWFHQIWVIVLLYCISLIASFRLFSDYRITHQNIRLGYAFPANFGLPMAEEEGFLKFNRAVEAQNVACCIRIPKMISFEYALSKKIYMLEWSCSIIKMPLWFVNIFFFLSIGICFQNWKHSIFYFLMGICKEMYGVLCMEEDPVCFWKRQKKHEKSNLVITSSSWQNSTWNKFSK